jgi:hypothetical protein
VRIGGRGVPGAVRHDAADWLVLPAGLACRGRFSLRVCSATPPFSCLKQITVTATIARGFGGAMKASSTLVVLKTSPF